MEINIQNLMDDARCYEAVRDSRWPGKIFCPHCNSDPGIHNEPFKNLTAIIAM